MKTAAVAAAAIIMILGAITITAPPAVAAAFLLGPASAGSVPSSSSVSSLSRHVSKHHALNQHRPSPFVAVTSGVSLASVTSLAASPATTTPAPLTGSNGLANDDDEKRDDAEDSIEEFERDVAAVIKTLRPGDRDPTIPPLFRNDLFPSFCHTWTLNDWDIHTTRWRYVRVRRHLDLAHENE
jgi:hypothetical protein